MKHSYRMLAKAAFQSAVFRTKIFIARAVCFTGIALISGSALSVAAKSFSNQEPVTQTPTASEFGLPATFDASVNKICNGNEACISHQTARQLVEESNCASPNPANLPRLNCDLN